MIMNNFNAKSQQKACAFCKYWYDPTNSAIAPKVPNAGLWLYDASAEHMCLKRNTKKRGFASCSDFVSKLPK